MGLHILQGINFLETKIVHLFTGIDCFSQAGMEPSNFFFQVINVVLQCCYFVLSCQNVFGEFRNYVFLKEKQPYVT